MTNRLFGTDGVRGVAFAAPLDRPTLARLGAALAAHLREKRLPSRVLIAGDTRASTPVLASWLGGALVSAGAQACWGGVLPTPAISHILRDAASYGAGLVVSASHNPAPDNGVKLVSREGTKWPVAQERGLEERMATVAEVAAEDWLEPADEDLEARYLELLTATLPRQALAGVRLVVDAANGAASSLAPELFARLGASVTVINAAPDGININAGCGAVHPAGLALAVVEAGADAGVALDGDADRAILVTHTGRVLDGDDALLIWSRDLAAATQLDNNTVVATIMSNLALEVALQRDGLRLVRCPVGDRDVWQAMAREGAALGGEQSGHVICAHHAVTGDGLLTAAHLLTIACRRGETLESLADLERYPQVLHNVRVARRRPIGDIPDLATAISAVEARLGGSGRVVVRYSGTEPLLRIMVEAADAGAAEDAASDLMEAALKHLGTPLVA